MYWLVDWLTDYCIDLIKNSCDDYFQVGPLGLSPKKIGEHFKSDIITTGTNTNTK